MTAQKKTPRAGGHNGALANRHPKSTIRIGERYGAAAILWAIAKMPAAELPSGCSALVAKAVLTSMVNFADWSTGELSASMQTIADAAGIAQERSVRRAVRLLEERGLIRCTQRADGGRGRVNRWRFDLDRMVSLIESDTENPDCGAGDNEVANPVSGARDTGEETRSESHGFEHETRSLARANPVSGAPKPLRHRPPFMNQEFMKGTEPAESADSDPLAGIERREYPERASRPGARRVSR